MTRMPTPAPRLNPTATQLVRGAPLREALLAQVRVWLAAHTTVPVRLVIVQVGDHAPSAAYIRHKVQACAGLGLPCEVVSVAANTGEAVLHARIRALVADPTVTAVIVQTPLPAGWDVRAALDMVPPDKDCDGLTTANAAQRAAGDARAIHPATPLGVMRLLAHMRIALAGTPVAVIGGGMVGGPLRGMLAQAGATVLAIDKATPDPAARCRSATVICSAAGVPGLVTAEWVRPGAVLVDIGITHVDGRLQGDVDAAGVDGIAARRTPVPGGVGPLTVASLLTNVIDCACMQHGLARPDWQVAEMGA